jgi:methyl-accepting chemotaxis protein
VTLSLGERVRSLHVLVAQMNIDSAKNETKIFARNMLAEISHQSAAVSPAETPDHHQCRFAKWYEGIGREEWGQLPAFQEVEVPLAALYQVARNLRVALKGGDREDTLHQGGEISRAAQELLSKLDTLSAAISEKQS